MLRNGPLPGESEKNTHGATRPATQTFGSAEKDGKPSDPVGFESLTSLEAGRLL